MITVVISFLTMAVTVLTPIVSFVFSVLWKITQKISPIILHELWQIAGFLFNSAVTAATTVHNQPKVTAIREVVISDIKELFIGLSPAEKTALISTPFILIAVVSYFIL